MTERIVNVLRCSPPEGEEPPLLKQWAPSCSDPFTATTFLDKPLQPYQARQARQCVMQQPPLRLSSVAASQSAAYRARHVLPTVASALRLDPRQSAALSNWRCSGDTEASKVASSMQMLHDQSKVPQQCISKVICIVGIAEVATRLDL